MEEQLRECHSQVNDTRLRELGDDIDDIEAETADPTVVGEELNHDTLEYGREVPRLMKAGTLQNSDMADTETQAGSGQGSGHGEGMEETRAVEAREEATRQLDEADTDEVFRWITQHMVENMGDEIL